MTDTAIIHVPHTRLDAAIAPDFRQMLNAEVGPECTRVLLDLSAVEFMDSTALGVLVWLVKHVGDRGAIAIAGTRPAVATLFRLTRFDSLLPICGSEEEARDALSL
ncbi:STAS domain-containing protein [Croceicoccus hydrothermalis]|uniref:STAS domain-containing protein n=1 Tax=Croceicoccus hydrothermalis TaxID=2867964 RepID=UPI001EFAECA2|nr:STAS domain-containing protein [Croceicoccus hydrothermalis]